MALACTILEQLALIFFVDSSAGQSICSCSEAFSNLRTCSIEIDGVAGSLHVRGIGTVTLFTTDADGKMVVILLHNCLQCDSQYNLISVSQLQSRPGNFAHTSNVDPSLHIDHNSGVGVLPLEIQAGLPGLRVQRSPITPVSCRVSGTIHSPISFDHCYSS